MDSDVIRTEIETTARRIDEDLRRLAERTRRATHTAVTWTAIALTTAGALAAIVFWRRQPHRTTARRSYEPPRYADQQTLPFPRAGAVVSRGAQKRSSA